MDWYTNIRTWYNIQWHSKGGTGLIQVVGLYWKIIAHMASLDPKLKRARLIIDYYLWLDGSRKSGGAMPSNSPTPSVPPVHSIIDLVVKGCMTTGLGIC